MPSLTITIVVLNEDKETVEAYFEKLADVVEKAVELSAFAFDTPTVFYDVKK